MVFFVLMFSVDENTPKFCIEIFFFLSPTPFYLLHLEARLLSLFFWSVLTIVMLLLFLLHLLHHQRMYFMYMCLHFCVL